MNLNQPPLNTVNLLPVLDAKLLELLNSLSPEDWNKQTVARLWKVKDVVAHLLDGNIRILSILRDNYQGEQPEIRSYQDLVDFLNRLNADWVQAMKRVSPEMLVLLHEITGKMYCDYYKSLDPFGKATFSVAWAGESESKNWMHIAREYTEKWLHQQQIRDAVNKPGLLTRELFYPFIQTFMFALPYTFKEVETEDGTTVQLTITSDIGGSWVVTRMNDQWVLSEGSLTNPDTEIHIDPDTAWKLFSKSLRPKDVTDKVSVNGNQKLGEVALTMVSVMA